MKPVKTILMDSIFDALSKIPSIRQIKRGPGIPIDQDTATYPWTCFFDEEETVVERNRVALKTFELVVQTWVVKTRENIEDQMDVVDADIESALLNDENLAKNCVRIIPKSRERFYVDDGQTGVLQSSYEVTYAHKWKDPYNSA